MRRILVSTADDDVAVKAVDIHNPEQEIGILRAVDWDGSGIPKASEEQTASIVAARFGAHSRSAKGLNLAALSPTLHFVGHYREPPFQLQLGLRQHRLLDATLAFDPYAQVWQVLGIQAADFDAQTSVNQHDNRYGRDHYEYCVSMWEKKH